ncbi:Transmembrane protein [Halotydeus destructor]|nr:Transmembrane protein [Halotydeus destructor]
MKSFTFSILIVAISFICSVDSKVVEGELITAKNWAFLSRFCFLSKDGRFKYQVQYPKDHEVQNILLYYDSNRQWPTVYKRGLDCTKQEAVLSTNNMQVINLTTRYQYSGCTERRVYSDDNETSSTVMVECDYHRYFESARERWWFIAVSNCASRKGLRLKYRFEMTNDREPWTKHFSADEFCKENRFRFVIYTPLLHCLQTGQCSRPPTRTGDGLVPVVALTIVSICLTDILHTDVIFLVLYTFLLFASFYGAYALHSRHLLHATYKIYMFSLLLELSALVCLVAHYALYAQDGVEEDTFKIAGKSLEAISTLVLLLLLILLAKGYTVTRARLKRKTTFKIIGFMALYTLVYAALFCWEKMVFDPGQVLYIYESPAGYGLIFLRLVGWAWFVYAVLFTLMHYPTNRHSSPGYFFVTAYGE